MTSALIDALNEIDNITAEKVNSTPMTQHDGCITSTDLTSSSQYESSDVEIINDHDYAMQSSDLISSKHEDSQVQSLKTIAEECAENVLPTAVDVISLRNNVDVFELSDTCTSDDCDASPSKRGRGSVVIHSRGHGRGRGRGRGLINGRGCARGRGQIRIQSHSSGQENSQHHRERSKPMRADTIDLQSTPSQYTLSVIKCNSSDGKAKTRFQLSCIQPNSDVTVETPYVKELTMSSSPSSSSSSSGHNSKQLTGSLERLSDEDHCKRDNISSCVKNQSDDDTNEHISWISKEIQELLCPNCGTWSFTLKHCSSCKKDFSYQLPRKFRSKSGQVETYVHVAPVTARQSYRDVNTPPPPRHTASTLKTTCETQATNCSTISQIETKQVSSSTDDTSDNIVNKLTQVTKSKYFSTSMHGLPANNFYSGKLQAQSAPYVSVLDGTVKPRKMCVSLVKRGTNRKRTKKAEPEVISIDCDSDNEDTSNSSGPTFGAVNRLHGANEDCAKSNVSRKSRMRDPAGNIIESKPIPRMPTLDTHSDTNTTDDITCGQLDNYIETVIPTITLQFGTLSIDHPLPAEFRCDRFLFKLGVAANYPQSSVYVDVKNLVSCEYTFAAGIQTIFLETTPHFANFLRERLRMIKGQAYFDPGSKVVAERRIVFRPLKDPLSSMDVKCLESIFNQIATNRKIDKEKLFIKLNRDDVVLALSQCCPNHHLDQEYGARFFPLQVKKEHMMKPCIDKTKPRSSIPEVFGMVSSTSSPTDEDERFSADSQKEILQTSKVTVNTGDSQNNINSTHLPQPVAILVYPPAPTKGRIVIHEVDIQCLQEGEFLNDVIIDFYIKYLVHEVLSETQREKAFVFSSFFYGRLMRREYSRDPSGGETPLTRMEKRHQKVRTWTRNVDIFQKDFIIVPINEHCHWYVAVICFPGLLTNPGYHTNHQTTLSDSSEGNTQDAENSENRQEDVYTPTDKETMCGDSDDRESNTSSSGTLLTRGLINDGDDEQPIDIDHNYSCQSNQKSSNMKRDKPITTDSPKVQVSSKEHQKVDLSSGNQESQTDCPVPPGHQPPSNAGDALYVKHQGIHCRRPCILIFDSLGGPSRRNVMQNLREYLTVEWQTRKKSKRIFDTKTIKAHQPKVPQQNNFSDCGVFLLQYVQMFFQKPIVNFTVPIKGLDTWFPESLVNKKRHDILHLIYELKQRHDGSTR